MSSYSVPTGFLLDFYWVSAKFPLSSYWATTELLVSYHRATTELPLSSCRAFTEIPPSFPTTSHDVHHCEVLRGEAQKSRHFEFDRSLKLVFIWVSSKQTRFCRSLIPFTDPFRQSLYWFFACTVVGGIFRMFASASRESQWIGSSTSFPIQPVFTILQVPTLLRAPRFFYDFSTSWSFSKFFQSSFLEFRKFL